MTEPSGSEHRIKPQITLHRPGSPGSTLIWVGFGITLLIGVAMSLASGGGDSSSFGEDTSAEAAAAAAADVAAVAAAEAAYEASKSANEGTDDASQADVADPEALRRATDDTKATIAAADAVGAVERAPDASENTERPESIELNGVTVSVDAGPTWHLARSDRQVMLLNSDANVLCQLTARNDAIPGGVKRDAAGDEAKFEAKYMAAILPFPGATRSATLLFREDGQDKYRYGVRVRVSIPTQSRVRPMDFVNAVAESATHMARMQCAPRQLGQAAEMKPAEVLAQSLQAR